MPIPDKIKNAPELLPGLQLYSQAFRRLNTCRSVGFGAGPIPWTATEQYCDQLELEGEQRDTMHHHIERMDECYLTWSAKKSAK